MLGTKTDTCVFQARSVVEVVRSNAEGSHPSDEMRADARRPCLYANAAQQGLVSSDLQQMHVLNFHQLVDVDTPRLPGFGVTVCERDLRRIYAV